jgi:hypothetical protein
MHHKEPHRPLCLRHDPGAKLFVPKYLYQVISLPDVLSHYFASPKSANHMKATNDI